MQGPPSHQAPAPAPRPRRDPRAGKDGGGWGWGAQHQHGTGGRPPCPKQHMQAPTRTHRFQGHSRAHSPGTCTRSHVPTHTPQQAATALLTEPGTAATQMRVHGDTHVRRRHPQASAHPHVRILARARVHKSLTPAHAFHAFRRGRDQGRRRGSAVLMATAGVRPERCVPSLTARQASHQCPHIEHALTHRRLWANT